MSYTYIQSEPRLWTVGHHDETGKFRPESDHGSPGEAAERVRFLNGGAPTRPEATGGNGMPVAGMTLREYFAGQALGELSNLSPTIAQPHEIAAMCVGLADALIQALGEE